MECMPRLKSYIINNDSSGTSFTIPGTTECFPTVQALCDAHIAAKTQFPMGGQLIKGIGRRPWQLLLSDIEFPNPEIPLGSGSFGKVIKAKLLKPGGEKIDVAVKSSTDENSAEIYPEMYTEARAMRALTNPNIIHLEGVVVEKLPILLVIEFIEGSSLHGALTKKKVSNVMRFPIVMGIIYGLVYMHQNSYIHRDIAARNVMVSHDMRTVKIIDFGLAKHALEMKALSACKIPVKWLAPETLTKWIFSTKSDTWSLAVTIWEIYHDGAEPYANVPASAFEPKPCTPSNTPILEKNSAGNNNGKSKTKGTETRKRRKPAHLRDTRRKTVQRPELPFTDNLDYLPKEFVPMLNGMRAQRLRDRIELSYVADQVEKVIYPTLPEAVKAELKIHIDKRPPFDPKFKVTVNIPSSMATEPTAPTTPVSKKNEVKEEPKIPKDTKDSNVVKVLKDTKDEKLFTGRRRTKKTEPGSSGAAPDKINNKVKTSRRKK
ncbi:hypothetical protein CAEBREN_28392 [Caenorhabditis brenneri]|uniref:Protein kinase domain-containing protein n=1 Tax=Caenorhabditis brenneri TaxID=135651 RepID=G0MBZ2_CAEBE|nr:hypothetical protein CAEBREN_28392 [Caenorhabditis brenneri]